MGAFYFYVEMGGIEPPCNEVLSKLLRCVVRLLFL